MNKRMMIICVAAVMLLGTCLAQDDDDDLGPSKKYTKNRKDKSIKINGKDLTRKSIAFDKDTPDVFYCIPEKPTGEDQIIVR